MSLLTSLAAVGAILGAVLLVGRGAATALFPAGTAWRAERWGWSFPLGAAVVAGETAGALAMGVVPGWISFLAAAVAVVAAAWIFRLRVGATDAPPRAPALSTVRWLIGLLLVSGVALYLLRALTEPMWSNDFLAIWGLKGKTIFLTHAFPQRAWPAGDYGFAHREYPLGLPLLYAGLAGLLGHWDDHAMALLFPCLQVSTLAVLAGWLRRRGAAWPIPSAAAALLSQFSSLYSAFLTGLAEVPLSCAFLLFGSALSDAIDREDPAAERRLAVASLSAAAIKDEGLFLAAAGAWIAFAASRSARWRVAACALVPAAAIAGFSRLSAGNAPLRDFDFTLLRSGIARLPARLGETLHAAATGVALPAWPGLACLVLLLLAGRRAAWADRLLGLAAACLGAYLLLPALAVLGPAWLVRTTLARTCAALAPLVAAGVAGRLATPQEGRRQSALG